MSTADDLHTEREQRLAEIRRREREATRRLLERLGAGELLDMCGLLGEDEGTPVLMPHAFNEPTRDASLSAPAAGTYR